jgi:hypothetical protein
MYIMENPSTVNNGKKAPIGQGNWHLKSARLTKLLVLLKSLLLANLEALGLLGGEIVVVVVGHFRD